MLNYIFYGLVFIIWLYLCFYNFFPNYKLQIILGLKKFEKLNKIIVIIFICCLITLIFLKLIFNDGLEKYWLEFVETPSLFVFCIFLEFGFNLLFFSVSMFFGRKIFDQKNKKNNSLQNNRSNKQDMIFFLFSFLSTWIFLIDLLPNWLVFIIALLIYLLFSIFNGKKHFFTIIVTMINLIVVFVFTWNLPLSLIACLFFKIFMYFFKLKFTKLNKEKTDDSLKEC